MEYCEIPAVEELGGNPNLAVDVSIWNDTGSKL
jgi:hypothetical protein